MTSWRGTRAFIAASDRSPARSAAGRSAGETTSPRTSEPIQVREEPVQVRGEPIQVRSRTRARCARAASRAATSATDIDEFTQLRRRPTCRDRRRATTAEKLDGTSGTGRIPILFFFLPVSSYCSMHPVSSVPFPTLSVCCLSYSSLVSFKSSREVCGAL